VSKNRVTLKPGVWGRSRSLKMAPFDRLDTTFYWSASVNIVLSCAVFESFDVEYRDLKIWVRGHSRSFNFKLVPFESLGPVFYSPSIMALSCLISEIKRDIGKKS